MMHQNLSEQVYALVRQVPKGKVTTYKSIADCLGVKCYRYIGKIMGKNPYFPSVPCHRVVNSNGIIGGFSNAKFRKGDLLIKEGIIIKNNKIENFKEVLFIFSSSS